jgi:glycine/betaine/sarcosine/D-proline reductase family selenoprotein B
MVYTDDFLEEQEKRYQLWLEKARPLLDAAKWRDAFKDYPFITTDNPPLTPLAKELNQCKLALISSGGFYIKGQAPFNAADVTGDYSYRELPKEFDRDEVGIAHDHYPHKYAQQDINCLLPVDRLGELERQGIIGELAARLYSISGYIPNAVPFIRESAPEIAARLIADQVDAALLVPA